MLNLLYRTCKDISDISKKKLLYTTWDWQFLDYASVIWTPYTEQIQRRSIRLILGEDLSQYERL